MSTASDPHGHQHAPPQQRYVPLRRRPRRGPDTGIFQRFNVLAKGLEALADKRSSSVPPTMRPPPPPPRASASAGRALILSEIEEVSVDEAPPSAPPRR